MLYGSISLTQIAPTAFGAEKTIGEGGKRRNSYRKMTFLLFWAQVEKGQLLTPYPINSVTGALRVDPVDSNCTYSLRGRENN
ncbi:hypothetical protein CDAR_293371 [Caerostris darwini]|uniref:Uncharacterized protein n=1 Tax=Caerostris darwini TaxID=1538125 RepID=A0AAV4UAJ4_9ARAC|nr:hypothetical protein CDAR_293371 [Caerostris darwini]